MMTWEEKTRKALKLMQKHGLTHWKLSIENLQNRTMFIGSEDEKVWGLCCLERKTIFIDSLCPDREFRQTVLHEIAHALTPDDPGHGNEWIRKADEVGCTFVRVFPYMMALRDGVLIP